MIAEAQGHVRTTVAGPHCIGIDRVYCDSIHASSVSCSDWIASRKILIGFEQHYITRNLIEILGGEGLRSTDKLQESSIFPTETCNQQGSFTCQTATSDGRYNRLMNDCFLLYSALNV